MVAFFNPKSLYAIFIFALLTVILGGVVVDYERSHLPPNLSDVAIMLMFLVIIVGCYWFKCSPVSRLERQIVWLFLIYALGLVSIAAAHDFKILFSFRVEIYWHALLLFTLFMAFRQIELSARFYWNLLAVLVLLIFAVALYAFFEDIDRANGVAANINSYGKLAGIAVVFFAIKLAFYRYDKPWKMVVDLSLMLMAALGLYVSETRAAWVAVLLTLIIVMPFLFQSVSFKKLGLSVAAFSVVVGVILLTNAEIIQRLAQGWHDIEQYHSGNIHTSWGYRLEMWRIVLLGFLEQPVWGHGLDAFNPYTRALKESGMTQLPSQFGSPHNEYLYMLFSVGMVGLLLFLSLLIGLLVLLSSAIGGVKNIRNSLYALLYFSLVVYIAITCFFDTSWSNKHVIYVYVFIIIMTTVMLQKDLKLKDD